MRWNNPAQAHRAKPKLHRARTMDTHPGRTGQHTFDIALATERTEKGHPAILLMSLKGVHSSKEKEGGKKRKQGGEDRRGREGRRWKGLTENNQVVKDQ